MAKKKTKVKPAKKAAPSKKATSSKKPAPGKKAPGGKVESKVSKEKKINPSLSLNDNFSVQKFQISMIIGIIISFFGVSATVVSLVLIMNDADASILWETFLNDPITYIEHFITNPNYTTIHLYCLLFIFGVILCVTGYLVWFIRIGGIHFEKQGLNKNKAWLGMLLVLFTCFIGMTIYFFYFGVNYRKVSNPEKYQQLIDEKIAAKIEKDIEKDNKKLEKLNLAEEKVKVNAKA